jgi:hypothetical protein
MKENNMKQAATKTSTNKKNSQWPETVVFVSKTLAIMLYATFKEIYIGFKLRIIPLPAMTVFWVLPAFIILYFRLDYWTLSFTRFENLYPFYAPLYWTYAFSFLYAPIWMWGALRAFQFQLYRRAVTRAFQDAGLVTLTGRMPKFIKDVPLDDAVREVQFATNGSPLSAFIQAKEHLSEVFGSIEEIKQIATGIVCIQYSHTELPKNTEIYDVPQVQDAGTFAVGYTRSGLLTETLSNVPHLLIGGRTNSGKSTFIRQFIVTLLAFSQYLQVYFVDLKYGLEAGPFDKTKRLTPITSVPKTLALFQSMEEMIKSRAEFLSLNGCSSIEDFYKSSRGNFKWTKTITSAQKMGRQVVIVDEASELFLAGGSADANQAKVARRLAIAIAAKGRALGIHLVIATQRPDKATVDMQIKTNLLGRLCFHMTDNHSSMTILDSVRAAHLPDQPGRAIWRMGSDQREVQTLYLTKENLKRILQNRKLTEEPGHSNNGIQSDMKASTVEPSETLQAALEPSSMVQNPTAFDRED